MVRAQDADGNKRMIAVGSKAYTAITEAAAPAKVAVGLSGSDGAPSAPVAAAPDDDFLAELFGATSKEVADDPFAVLGRAAKDGGEKRRAEVARVRSIIDGEKKRAQAEHDDWSGRVYKQNKTQVELRGDGPSNQASMSVGSINEGRRQKAMEALSQEISSLDRLATALSTDEGAERVLTNLLGLMVRAKQAVGTAWAESLGLKTADQAFEALLLDDLKFRGPAGRGNVMSNGLSKAALRIVNGEAAPATKNPTPRSADAVATKDSGGAPDRALDQGGSPADSLRTRIEKRKTDLAAEVKRNTNPFMQRLDALRALRSCLNG
jgi:hypothetical protein